MAKTANWKACLTKEQKRHLRALSIKTLPKFRVLRKAQHALEAAGAQEPVCWDCENIEHRMQDVKGGPKVLAVLDACGEVLAAAQFLLDELEGISSTSLCLGERHALQDAVTHAWDARRKLHGEGGKQ